MSMYRNTKPTDTLCGWSGCKDVCEEGIGVCRHHALLAYAWVLGNIELPKYGVHKPIVKPPPIRPTATNPSPGVRPRSPMKYTPGLVYAIETEGNIKLGFTTNYPERMRALRPDVELGVMPGTMADEEALHERFARHRIRGEWFRPAREIKAFIRNNMQPYEKQVA